MISDQYKCIFVHIPKAAGKSVEHFFLNLHGLSWNDRAPLLLRPNPDPEKGPQRLAHLKATEYMDCGYVDEKTFEDYFKFTFVRNPWSRLVSEYRYRDYHKKMSFRDFVFNGLPEESSYTDAYRHIVPQYDFLYDSAGNQLVDFVGKFETIQKDFDQVCAQLNIADSHLSHVNSSSFKTYVKESLEKIKRLVLFQGKKKRYPYTDLYDHETIAAVEKMYEKDIDTFKYSFGE